MRLSRCRDDSPRHRRRHFGSRAASRSTVSRLTPEQRWLAGAQGNTAQVNWGRYSPHTASLGDTGWCSCTSADGGTRECTSSEVVRPWCRRWDRQPGRSRAASHRAVRCDGHCPFWQVPPVQGVPNGLGWILPALQRFLPFFLSHVPFLQVSHSPGGRGHLPHLAASASSEAASPNAPSTTPSVAIRDRRREPITVRERDRESKCQRPCREPPG